MLKDQDDFKEKLSKTVGWTQLSDTGLKLASEKLAGSEALLVFPYALSIPPISGMLNSTAIGCMQLIRGGVVLEALENNPTTIIRGEFKTDIITSSDNRGVIVFGFDKKAGYGNVTSYNMMEKALARANQVLGSFGLSTLPPIPPRK